MIVKIKDIVHNIKVKLKKFIYNLIESMVQKFNRYNLKHMQDFIVVENKYKYEDLMPKVDYVKNKQYSETLEWALKNYNIKNIALTGVYGSGKSTILKTFETLHKEYKYLNISMATFNDGLEKNKVIEDKEQNVESESDKAKKVSSVTTTIDNAVIEKGILQQMFYKVKYKSIPGSRYKRIRNYKFSNILFKTIIILDAILFGVILYKPEIFSKLYENVLYIQNTFKINSMITYSFGLLLFILVISILTPAIRYLSNGFKITKISTKAGDAQLDDSEKSIFNKYIDEILYFFEMSKYDVVVFEDLDRFNNIEIFSKLRELNSLINNSEQISRRVVFIYAIKDDIFSNAENKDDKFHYKNRTKFFDFIIPVVQVANSSNACNLMIKKFGEAGLLDELGEEFISDIAFLINDMRVLNNIFNEYIVYKENLKHIDEQDIHDEDNNQYENKLDPTKLLAIIVYKNMYPADFAKLQDDDGMVYEIFKNKDKLIESKIKQLKEEYKEIEEKIDYAEKEFLQKNNELRIVYAHYIINYNNGNTVFIGGRNLNQISLSYEFEFNLFLSQNQNNDSKYSKLIEEYFQREEVIKLGKNNALEYAKRELDNKKKEINLIRSKPLKESINDNNIKEIFKGDIDNADLLKFLIKEGHIDESYSEYISYFYGGVISPRDNEFIHNVMFGKEMEFGITLDKPKNVIKKIHEYRFAQKYVLNYNLLDFIIENIDGNKKCKDCYILIMEQLSEGINFGFNMDSNTYIPFIEGYIDRQNHLDIFIESLCNAWPEMWSYIQMQANFTEEKKNQYLKYIFEFGKNEDVIGMDKGSQLLEEYVSQTPEFIDLMDDESKFEKVEELLTKLYVKFECLNKKIYNNELFEFVVKNDLYEINIHMIELILENIYDVTLEELPILNYNAIVKSSCNSLIEYINRNINTYIENVFLVLNNNTDELEKIMIDLLKRDDISRENKQAMIRKENIIFSDVNEIEDTTIWASLIKNDKMESNWNNVIQYYKKFSFEDGILETFLIKENVYEELSKYEIRNELAQFDENYLIEFSRQIILNNNLAEECFKELVKSISYKNIPIAIEKIKLDRIDIIIEYGILSLTKDNYNNLKQYFEDKHLMLLEKNIDEYINNHTEYNLDSKDVMNLLDASIENDKKLFIMNNMNLALVDESDALVGKIVDFMLDNNILLELDEILLNGIMANTNITEKNKVLILVNQIEFMDIDKTFKFLSMISDVYSDLSEMDNEITIQNNVHNEKLTKALKSKDYINEFYHNEDYIVIVTKTA